MSSSQVQHDESQPPEIPEGGRRGRSGQRGARRTLSGSAWGAVVATVILGVALVDFIVQNTRSVRIEFFSANEQMPIAVALIGAAVVGALLVLAVGVARTAQRRMATRRGAKRQRRSASPATNREG